MKIMQLQKGSFKTTFNVLYRIRPQPSPPLIIEMILVPAKSLFFIIERFVTDKAKVYQLPPRSFKM